MLSQGKQIWLTAPSLLGRAAVEYRMSRGADGLQLDFLTAIDGIRSFETLRSGAREVQFANARLRVASLADIIKSKKAAGRPSDMAALPVLEKTLAETAYHTKSTSGRAQEGK